MWRSCLTRHRIRLCAGVTTCLLLTLACQRRSAMPREEPAERRVRDYSAVVSTNPTSDHAWRMHVASIMDQRSISGEWRRLGPGVEAFVVGEADRHQASLVLEIESTIRGRHPEDPPGYCMNRIEAGLRELESDAGLAAGALERVVSSGVLQSKRTASRLLMAMPVMCDELISDALARLDEAHPALAAAVRSAMDEHGVGRDGQLVSLRAISRPYQRRPGVMDEAFDALVCVRARESEGTELSIVQVIERGGSWVVHDAK